MTWSTATAEMLRTIAGQDAPQNFYLLDRREVPSELQGEQALAYTAAALDLKLCQHLDAQGDWHGEGFAAVFDLEAIGDDLRQIFAVAVHEFAHWLADRQTPWWEYVRAAFLRDMITDESNRKAGTLTAPAATLVSGVVPAARPWVRHELPFIRTAIHLLDRAKSLRIKLDVDAARIAGAAYGLSGAHVYWLAIGDEPRRFFGHSFSDIHAEPYPEAFQALWDADVSRHRERNPE